MPFSTIGDRKKIHRGREERSPLSNIYIHIYVYAQILVAWFHSLTVDISKVRRWYEMMTDCLKQYVLAFFINSSLLPQDRSRWANDNRANFFSLSFYIYKTTSFIPTTDNWSSERNKAKQWCSLSFCPSVECSFSIYFSYLWCSFL